MRAEKLSPPPHVGSYGQSQFEGRLVFRFDRRLILLIGALLTGSLRCPGQTTAHLPPATPNVATPKQTVFWDTTIDLRVAGGYKDNVLLAHTQPTASALVNSGLDVIVFRLPLEGPQFYFFLSGEDLRYFSGDVDKEQTLFAQAQLKKDFGQQWNVGFELGYLYQDQVFDVSTTENINTLQAQGHAITGRPILRRNLANQFWVEVAPEVSRQLFRAPLDNYWEGGARITLGRDYGRRSELNLSLESTRRVYDRREQLDAQGFPIAATALRIQREAMQFVQRHYWDERRRWRTTTKLLFELNEDNGTGYFDYKKYQISEQFRYQTKGWEITAQGKFNFYDYTVQTVSETDSTPRHRSGLVLSLRVEKSVTKDLKLYVNCEHERLISNRYIDEYKVNQVSSGAEWEF